MPSLRRVFASDRAQSGRTTASHPRTNRLAATSATPSLIARKKRNAKIKRNRQPSRRRVGASGRESRPSLDGIGCANALNVGRGVWHSGSGDGRYLHVTGSLWASHFPGPEGSVAGEADFSAGRTAICSRGNVTLATGRSNNPISEAHHSADRASSAVVRARNGLRKPTTKAPSP